MKWFGDPWNCRACNPAEKVPTPVDAFCHHCERPILDRDQGFVLPFAHAPGFVVTHLDCILHCLGVIPCSPKFHPPEKECLS